MQFKSKNTLNIKTKQLLYKNLWKLLLKIYCSICNIKGFNSIWLVFGLNKSYKDFKFYMIIILYMGI